MSGEAPKFEQRAMKPTGPLEIGERFLTWEIRGLLGKGGHAFVYDAYDVLLGEEVALKILPNPPELKRAKNEARVAKMLDHPGIVKTTHVGVTESGLVYFVMEKLHGCTIRQALAHFGCLTVFEMLGTAWQIGEAVAYAHAQGVIHRDLKPDNALYQDPATRRDRDQKSVVRVLDFGIAKIIGEAALTTQKDLIHGTPWYISPEQLQGHPASEQSDVFALGVMMFEMVHGVPPARIGLEGGGGGFEAIGWAQLHNVVPRLDALRPEVPAHVARVVQHALAKNPKERFATMAELAAACQASAQRLIVEANEQGIQLNGRPLWHARAVSAEASKAKAAHAAKQAAQAIEAGTARADVGAPVHDRNPSERPISEQTMPLYREAPAVAAPAAREAKPPRPRLRPPGGSASPAATSAQFISGVVPTQAGEARRSEAPPPGSIQAPTQAPRDPLTPRAASPRPEVTDSRLTVKTALILGGVAGVIFLLSMTLIVRFPQAAQPHTKPPPSAPSPSPAALVAPTSGMPDTARALSAPMTEPSPSATIDPSSARSSRTATPPLMPPPRAAASHAPSTLTKNAPTTVGSTKQPVPDFSVPWFPAQKTEPPAAVTPKPALTAPSSAPRVRPSIY